VGSPQFKLLDDDECRIRGSLEDIGLLDRPDWLQPVVVVVVHVVGVVLYALVLFLDAL
jgi:hypothetical protein